jgi:hypothetical protein
LTTDEDDKIPVKNFYFLNLEDTTRTSRDEEIVKKIGERGFPAKFGVN